jgi:hypothetical protein
VWRTALSKSTPTKNLIFALNLCGYHGKGLTLFLDFGNLKTFIIKFLFSVKVSGDIVLTIIWSFLSG